MASITVRNIDEKTKKAIKLRAARNGRSMEEEARLILRQAVQPQASRKGLGTAIHEMFKAVGGADDLEVLPRRPMRDPPDFSNW